MAEAIQSAGTESTTLDQEVLVLFTAAPPHYVTPKSYTETKPTTAKIDDLSRHTETSVMDHTGKVDGSGPWKVADAPERYIELMKKNIIGIEIAIERLEGKFKMNQEMRKGGREGVIRGFQSLGSDDGQAISALV
ncbi:transcriptional regulator [Colletotrichum scovillei]|nr:transcriptional regulator [Colletotrichum scovillei]